MYGMYVQVLYKKFKSTQLWFQYKPSILFLHYLRGLVMYALISTDISVFDNVKFIYNKYQS